MSRKTRLVLIRGGASELGPISRLGLWDRFPRQPKRAVYFHIVAKILLVASILYYLLAA